MGDADSDDRRNDSVQLPNVGSALHGTGSCRPCAWFHKSTSCQKNKECSFCHLCPESALKARKKNKMMAAARKGLSAASLPDPQVERHPSHSALSLASFL